MPLFGAAPASGTGKRAMGGHDANRHLKYLANVISTRESCFKTVSFGVPS